jgi:hypothetical protein
MRERERDKETGKNLKEGNTDVGQKRDPEALLPSPSVRGGEEVLSFLSVGIPCRVCFFLRELSVLDFFSLSPPRELDPSPREDEPDDSARHTAVVCVPAAAVVASHCIEERKKERNEKKFKT